MRPQASSIETGSLIGSSFVQGRGATLILRDPSTQEEVAKVASVLEQDVDHAVGLATEAQIRYYELGPEQWASKLNKLADLIDEHAQELAALDAICGGRPIGMAADIPIASKTIRLCAAQAILHHGQTSQQQGDALSFTLREPFGVCAGKPFLPENPTESRELNKLWRSTAICPWNVPVVLCAAKLAPALAAGNAIILKPSERSPLSITFLAKLALAAGFPPGLVQVLHGTGDVGAWLASHPKIRRIAFTGSTATGRKIVKLAADSNLKKVTLELGGKGAAVVFDDVPDLDRAVQEIAFSVSWITGQMCMAQTRIYVQSGIADRFVEAFKAHFLNCPVGDPFDAKTIMGPIIDQRGMDQVNDFLQQAREEGATILQGSVPSGKGLFVPPTILQGLKQTSSVMTGEIFGPVTHISTFKTEEEAIQLANDTEFGLYNCVYTKDGARGLRCARRISAGIVGVNTSPPNFDISLPFGGVRQSGWGKEWGPDSLDEWTETKSVCFKM
ncbi:hypothetical protein OC845_000733 [Tilletia horrida]|nr:hypothetical protein OC845_000733 [Tilletia horrida]